MRTKLFLLVTTAFFGLSSFAFAADKTITVTFTNSSKVTFSKLKLNIDSAIDSSQSITKGALPLAPGQSITYTFNTYNKPKPNAFAVTFSSADCTADFCLENSAFCTDPRKEFSSGNYAMDFSYNVNGIPRINCHKTPDANEEKITSSIVNKSQSTFTHLEVMPNVPYSITSGVIPLVPGKMLTLELEKKSVQTPGATPNSPLITVKLSPDCSEGNCEFSAICADKKSVPKGLTSGTYLAADTIATDKGRMIDCDLVSDIVNPIFIIVKNETTATFTRFDAAIPIFMEFSLVFGKMPLEPEQSVGIVMDNRSKLFEFYVSCSSGVCGTAVCNPLFYGAYSLTGLSPMYNCIKVAD